MQTSLLRSVFKFKKFTKINLPRLIFKKKHAIIDLWRSVCAKDHKNINLKSINKKQYSFKLININLLVVKMYHTTMNMRVQTSYGVFYYFVLFRKRPHKVSIFQKQKFNQFLSKTLK